MLALMQTPSTRHRALATTAAALALLAWDATGFDLALAHAFGTHEGFPWRDHWLLSGVLHDGGRRVAWALTLSLVLAVWWPWGPLRRLSPSARAQLAVTTLVAALAISTLKSFSHTSCPWDMTEFGGVARYTSHWTHWLQPDGGSGRCFPAGHASAGFALVGGYFVFSPQQPLLARRWLLGALAAGLLLGVGQQLRGAHFMSHTLWTGWACWCVAWAMDAVWVRSAGLPASPSWQVRP